MAGTVTMTGNEIRQAICGKARSFTLSTADIKERIGHPDSIKILPRWCKRTGRDVLVLTYETDEGEAQVLGTVGFLNGEETIFDGWIVLSDRSDDTTQIHGERSSIEVQQTLFEDWAIVPVEDDEEGQAQQVGSQGGGAADDEPTLFDG